MEIKKVALTVGIAVLFTLFVVFFVDAVYEQPKYENYCNYSPYREPLPLGKSQEECPLSYNHELFDECIKQKGEIRYRTDEIGCQVDPYCDFCGKNFSETNAHYNRNIFFIAAIIGIAAIIAVLYMAKKFDAISSGFIFAGILILLQGTVRVFGDLEKWPRVIVLGVELVILILIGIKKIRK